MSHHPIPAGGPLTAARPAAVENTAPSGPNRLRPGALDAAILEADRMALALRAALERITIPLAWAAQAFVRKKAWFPFGHARVADHARERFGHLEDHHVHYRSRGSSDEASNRTCLCRFHHQRGEHGDLASCRGKAPLGLLWRLGKPGLASWFRSERRLAQR